MSRIHHHFALLTLLLVFAGCNEDPATQPAAVPGAVWVDINPAAPDFTLRMETADTPDRPARGPFVLRGRNLHYDDEAGALVIDLTITNDSPATFVNPVSITFLALRPDSTMILNSPDDGPTLYFEFANDDLWWTPGETSLPLTVMFRVGPGVSIGFSAHIGVGGVQDQGRISGRVWNDGNRNGLIDADEQGLGAVAVVLADANATKHDDRTYTDRQGRYEFRSLEAGTYEVRIGTVPYHMDSTTSLSIHVLLTPSDTGVSSFTDANFGFAPAGPRLPGPKLVVEGKLLGRLIAFRGETVRELVVPPDSTLHFAWAGFADRGHEVVSYRYGWDVADPDDPDDPGWQVAPGLRPEHRTADWDRPLTSGAVHGLVIECRDSDGHLTRVTIRFRAVER